MLKLICKAIEQVKHASIRVSVVPSLQLPRNPGSCLPVRSFANASNQHSFTVSYLINSCGLSSDSALFASKCVSFETPDRPNEVVRFFETHGFSKTQISSIIGKFPKLLVYYPEQTLLPKFEFFYTKGISPGDLVGILCRNPHILQRSLTGRIIPNYNLLQNLLQSDVKANKFIRGNPFSFSKNLEKILLPAVGLLRGYGVPESNILLLLLHNTSFCRADPDSFSKSVEKVKELGFDPLKSQFVVAARVLCVLSRSTWQRKVDAYKKWGWSDEDIHQAFRKYPLCMMNSVDKIVAIMEIFVNKLGRESSYLAKNPSIFALSLERRIKPRVAVLEFLLSKGVMGESTLPTSFFKDSEELFVKKFVDCHAGEAPQILKLYKKAKELAE